MNTRSRIAGTAVSSVTLPLRAAGLAFGVASGLVTVGVRTVGRLITGAGGRAGAHETAPPRTPPRTAPVRGADRDPVEEVTPPPTEPAGVDPDAPRSQPPEATPETEELRTPSGIPAADPAYNPDTTESDLHQRDTEPIVDPATAKSIRSESEVLRRAADRDKS